MSEGLSRFDHIHAGSCLVARTLPVHTATADAPMRMTRVLNSGGLASGAEFMGGVASALFLVNVGAFSAISPSVSRTEKICRDLERLEDGWCGAGSLAPSRRTLADLDLLLNAIPHEARAPEVEVDESTGFVTLRWAGAGQPVAFSFVLRGDGQAIAVKTTLTAPTRAVSRLFSIATEQPAIERYLSSDDQLTGLLGTE